MFEITVFITQSLIIIGLLVFIYVIIRHYTRQLEKLNLALMSRSTGEYVNAVKTQEQAEPGQRQDVDEIELGEATDDVFDRHIQDQNK